MDGGEESEWEDLSEVVVMGVSSGGGDEENVFTFIRFGGKELREQGDESIGDGKGQEELRKFTTKGRK